MNGETNEPTPLLLTASELSFWERIVLAQVTCGSAWFAIATADSAVRARRARYTSTTKPPYR